MSLSLLNTKLYLLSTAEFFSVKILFHFPFLSLGLFSNNFNSSWSKSLANAMIQLLEETDNKTQSMGRESFILAKEKYAVERVNKDIINILNL